MYTNAFKVILFFCFGLLFFIFPAHAEQLDRSDAVKVANTVLQALIHDNYEAIVDLMSPEQKEEYMPLTPERLKELEKFFSKDKKKAGNSTSVTEICKITTYRGKTGVAAKVNTKGDEVYVIILALEGSMYFFEDALSLSNSLYKKLEVLQTIK